MNRTICIVEDNLHYRTFLKHALIKENYSVIDFSNGQDALEWFKTTKDYPSLIICDIMMPFMDGIEFVAGIRSIGIKTRVLMLTAKRMIHDIETAYEAGCDWYLVKGTNENDIVNVVNREVVKIS